MTLQRRSLEATVCSEKWKAKSLTCLALVFKMVCNETEMVSTVKQKISGVSFPFPSHT